MQETDIVVLQLGKKGLTTEFMDLIKKTLNQKKKVKIKFLKNSMESLTRKELAEQLFVDLTSQKIMFSGKLVGNTYTIIKK